MGRSVESELAARTATWHPGFEFSWGHPQAVGRELTTACRAFANEVGSSSWQIMWCAGSGVVGSGSEDLEKETRAFAHLLSRVTETLCVRGKSRGAMFLASSAGGVYAGSAGPPFSEVSAVAPLAPYGWNKLKQEALACQWSGHTETPLLIGRLSNIYGPGQNLTKKQGLITQICVRILAHQPVILYVPLDTIRDYLYVKDAGRLVADGMERLYAEASSASCAPAVVKNLASQHPATIGMVLAQIRWITKRPVSVIIAASPNARHQAPDLRMTSSIWPELDNQPTATLGEGMRSVFNGILETVSEGGFAIESSPARCALTS